MISKYFSSFTFSALAGGITRQGFAGFSDFTAMMYSHLWYLLSQVLLASKMFF